MRNLPIALLLLLIPFAALAQTDIVPGIIILKIRPEFKQNLLRDGAQWETFAGMEVQSVRQMFPRAEAPDGRTDDRGNAWADLTRTFRLHLPPHADLRAATAKLMASGRFDWVEHTTYSISFSTPNDPSIGSQDHLVQIGAFAAWDVSQGDTNVVIGITDTSFDLLHQDLQDNLKYNWGDTIDGADNDLDGFIDNYAGWDIESNDNNLFVANNWHGTGVLAVQSASTDNGIGIAGVGYNCKYLPVKIGNSIGEISTADGYEAITYCADRDCKVINCSWGTTTFSNLGQDVVNYATFNMDALVVAAAGNEPFEEFRYPASFANALSVTGVHNSDVFNNGSNPTFTWADSVDLCAQGFYVFSTATLGGTPGASPIYTTTGGTSYAAPQVSGAAGLVRSQFTCLTALETADLLLASAVDIEAMGTNSDYAGKIGKRLDMAAALNPAADPCEPIGLTGPGGRQLFLVHPNPAVSDFAVRTTAPGNWVLTVMDAQGKRVSEQRFTGTVHTVSGLAPGPYTLSLDNGTGMSVQRVVVVGH
ncbi:MAG: S8 family peptidase [Flavobacteriales bacterium]|nr:S8 family peptidase [Flavobacteriales bacterium]